VGVGAYLFLAKERTANASERPQNLTSQL